MEEHYTERFNGQIYCVCSLGFWVCFLSRLLFVCDFVGKKKGYEEERERERERFL